VLNRMAAVCCSVQHFGEQCTHARAYQELQKFSDFDLNYLCLEYPSFLGALQLPSSVLYDSPKMRRLETLLPKLIVSERCDCPPVYPYIYLYLGCMLCRSDATVRHVSLC
jgi:hypothetical protein